MPDMLTPEDVTLILRALDAISRYPLSDFALNRAEQIKRRIMAGYLTFNSGEIGNICIGLELLLDDNPLDWKVSQLLSRLRKDLAAADPRHGNGA